MPAAPRFFPTLAAWRRWLKANHATQSEILVGLHKKHTGKPSITWPESVDGALAFGWIDGIRRSIDAHAYSIRFTPRRKGSIWSAINIRRANALISEGTMAPAGLRAFEARSPDKSAIYAYEQRQHPELAPAEQRRLKANKAAWKYFESRAPSYRRVAVYWVVSAKQSVTRERRLAALIADSEAGRLIKSQRRRGT